MHKIREAMKSSEVLPMNGKPNVDKYVVVDMKKVNQVYELRQY
jgi:hypothetical protein